jgi:RimJ/RimL family protein N-acetyltransferase
MTDVEVRFGGVPEMVDAGVVMLRRWTIADVPAEVAAINASLEHLRPWMPWAASPATEQSVGEFIGNAITAWDSGSAFDFAIRDRGTDEIIGGCGLMARRGPGVLEIGYWVAAHRSGQGVGTAVTQALTSVARTVDACERVEIHCDERNVASAAIPRRLGYALDRTEPREPTAAGESDQSQVWVLELDARR